MNEKDKEAIQHIASVSKNPQAALIVKQLITGWDLKNTNTGVVIKDTKWLSDGFELIEPKPAYRVYIEKSGGLPPETVTRKSYERYRDSYDDNVNWISDWIEYDEPKEWPTPLVERIAEIDIAAAEWIIDNQDDLTVRIKSKLLCSMFNWDQTPQGYDYWSKISKELGE